MQVSYGLQQATFVRTLRVFCCTAAIMLFGTLSTADAQEPAPAEATEAEADGAAETEEDAEKEKPRPIIELGYFKINDLRPTRNETAKLTFSMHLAFSKDLNETQRRQLEDWKHRLRDQVITAVRISMIKDFQEPDLSRLRRAVLIRVNRLFKEKLAEEVLLTEYIFRLH